MNHKYLYLLLLFLIVSCQRNVETGPPVLKEMCQRLFPRHAQSFLFELLTDSIDTDRFILESSQGKIRIKGNNRNSLAAWESPGKNIGVGCPALLHESFLIQGSSPRL